jgi:ankyrin repeat protein
MTHFRALPQPLRSSVPETLPDSAPNVPIGQRMVTQKIIFKANCTTRGFARDVRDLAQLLIQHGKAGNDNRIHDAERDLQEQVSALLKANPLLISAKRRDNEWTPLHVAAAHGHVKIAEMLFEHKADIDARTNMGYTPLQLALANDKGIMIGPLCAHGANVNAKSNDGGWSGPQF